MGLPVCDTLPGTAGSGNRFRDHCRTSRVQNTTLTHSIITLADGPHLSLWRPQIWPSGLEPSEPEARGAPWSLEGLNLVMPGAYTKMRRQE